MKHILLALAIVAALAVALWVGVYRPHEVPDQKVTSSVESEIETFTLSNGMEVVLLPNRRIPAVSHTLWVRVGAADDPQGKSGLAHYLEHLMFEGTVEHEGGAYDRTIEALGGQFNAFTGADYTGYYVNVATEHLPEVMALEAERLTALAPAPASFANELKVIVEERKSRVENNPRALLSEAMASALFRHHPYRIPIIGWMHEMEQLTPQDALDFYHQHYHAGNMLLVVAGDITRKELEPLAERYYGAISARKASSRNWLKEPPQRAPRRIVMRHQQVQQPLWIRSYIAPSLIDGTRTKYALPLELLAVWMGQGNNSLLYRELVVKQKLAVSVNASYSSLTRGPSQFQIAVMPADGVTMKQISRAVAQMVRHVQDVSITADDLVRLKTLMKADVIYARDGLQPVAQMVGTLRVLGLDVGYYTQWPSRIAAITADQVRGAAKATLMLDHSVTAMLLPKPANPVEKSDGRTH